jgi:RNA polymerase sigma-70 factor (ECF subfamily)
MLHNIQKPHQNTDMNELLEKYMEKAYSIAYKFTGDPNDASDLVQNVFIKILKNQNQYIPDKGFEQWMYAIIRNLYIDTTRKKREVEMTGTIENITADPAPSPGNEMEKKEMAAVIKAQLMTMEPSLRAVAVLVDMEGYSYKEAAEILDCPLGTVCMRLHQARKILKQKLSYLLKEE